MTHEQAAEQHAAEGYLLGELTGENRAAFEEHLFGCAECTADVKDGALLLQGARQQFLREAGRPAASSSRKQSGGVRPFAVIAASFLIAALGSVISYQNFVQIPALHHQLAHAAAPSVLQELVLAGAGTRGDAALPEVRLSAKESLLLSVDIPAPGSYEKYVCSLTTAGGKLLWQLEIAPTVTETAVPLRVPAQSLSEGENTLRIEGLSRRSTGESTPPVDLATYRFHVVLKR